MKAKDQTNLKVLPRAASAKHPPIWHTIRTCIFPKPKAEGAPDWHTLLALSMVIVATLGAIVAGGTAVAEQEANRLERFLTWGHRIAATERQQLLADAGTRRGLELRINSYRRLGREYLQAARRQPAQGGCLQRQAQEEFAAARALEPCLAALPDLGDEKNPGSLEQSLQEIVAFYMTNLGYETVWHRDSGAEKAPRQTGPPKSMWEPLDQKLDAAHCMVKMLAFDVVWFVAALILLTLSSIFGRQQFLQNRFYLAAGLVALGATAFVFYVVGLHWGLIWDLLTIMYWQGLLLVFLAPPCLLMVLLFWTIINFWRQCRRWNKSRPKRQVEPRYRTLLEADAVKPDIPLPPLRETGDEFSRCTVLLIAITVFGSALCGLGYSYSASKAGTAAHEALKSLLKMDISSSRRHADQNDILLQLADFREYRARFSVGLGDVQDETALLKGGSSTLTGSQVKGPAQLPGSWRDDETTRQLRSHFPDAPHFGINVEALPAIDAQPLEVGGNLGFPVKITWPPADRSDNNWWEPIAERYAFSRSSVAWHAKAQIFLGILTVLAMAIYLFAQAHGMVRGSGGNLLIRNGVLLLMIGVLCFGITLVPDLLGGSRAATQERLQAQAAASYAIAHQESLTEQASQNYQELMNRYRETIDKSPKSNLAPPGPAAPLEAGKVSQAESPPGPQQLDAPMVESIRHQEKVLDILRQTGHAEPPELLSNLGLGKLLLGVNNHNLAEMRRSLEYLQRAEEKAALGGNRKERAVIHWNLALARLAYGKSPAIDPEAIRQLIGTEDRSLILSGFTELGILERSFCAPEAKDKDLCAAVQKAKEQLVDAWPLPNSPSRPTASRLPECDSHTGESTYIQVSPQAVQWRGQLPQFRPGPDHLVLVWYAKDRQGTMWRALPLVSGPVDASELTPAKNSPESWVITRSFLTLSGYKRCLSAGLYKAELYLNGRLISAPTETRNAFGDFTPTALLDLNVGLCLPKSWESIDVPKELGDLNLLGRGYQSPEHQPAAFVFTFYSQAVDKTAAVQRARELLAKGPWNIKAADVFSPYDPGDCQAVTPSPRGLYRYWFTSEGVEHVGMVLLDAAPRCELCNILDSMGNIYP